MYACTVWSEERPFVSAVAAAAGRPAADPELVHVIYGLSKDFCMSGLRVGVFHSRCAPLVEALSGIAMFTSVCSLTQHALACVFEDLEFIGDFISDNLAAVRASHAVLADGLAAHGIPFVRGDGGLFLWVNLGGILRAPGGGEVTREAVLGLVHHLAHHEKVLITPGHLCHASEHGWFRICFTAMGPEALGELVRRLGLVYSYYRAS